MVFWNLNDGLIISSLLSGYLKFFGVKTRTIY